MVDARKDTGQHHVVFHCLLVQGACDGPLILVVVEVSLLAELGDLLKVGDDTAGHSMYVPFISPHM